ncbi:SprT family zinc-dependent metalloprotease [Thermaerobacter subterraneus]|uniref:Metal-dependent hydrolase n=1 Tax=Thermaerobacter subterraneus DSM 13965 TaxID=867903 RepID=K6PS83_9FIRM|nr:SprT family zinc-dependent metalloprotease [Thermaerobacter subterraneus]EKP95827.1 putative metal-dependent hydrolase [Thermaerobacter subterraneus DSM 13965]
MGEGSRDGDRGLRPPGGMGQGGAGSQGLPPYTVRVSSRARRVRLVLSPADGLVVVVPPGYRLQRVPQVVAQHAAWIQRARQRLEQQARAAGGGAGDPLLRQDAAGLAPPAWLWLRALGEVWAVTPAGRPTLGGAAGGGGKPAAGRTPQQALFAGGVTGDPGEPPPPGASLAGQVRLPARAGEQGPAAWGPPLRGWLAARARATLLPWLERLARERGFRLAGSSIGCPKTRWGSCSAGRHVRLSLKLLFLPPELVEHVLIHELCHTVHLNHGPAFWALVERHDPRAAQHRRQLRAAWSYVPAWLRPARSIGPSPADARW